MRVAFTTFGALPAELHHPLRKGFVDRTQGVFLSAESGHGFIDREGRYGADTTQFTWGEIEPPSLLAPGECSRVAATLSLWEDLESVFAFATSGAYGEALKHRKEGFRKLERPT